MYNHIICNLFILSEYNHGYQKFRYVYMLSYHTLKRNMKATQHLKRCKLYEIYMAIVQLSQLLQKTQAFTRIEACLNFNKLII